MYYGVSHQSCYWEKSEMSTRDKKKKKNAETELEVERHLRLNDPLALYTLQSFYLRKPHRLCNCLRARPECGISWVRVPVWSNQRLWY